MENFYGKCEIIDSLMEYYLEFLVLFQFVQFSPDLPQECLTVRSFDFIARRMIDLNSKNFIVNNKTMT